MRAEIGYYVYALKDPRSNPAQPFYIGKGTGVRAWEHEINCDQTLKGNSCWSIPGLLMEEGKLKRVEKKRHKAQVR